jgi:Cof subfamily protein (haloacid dehalogenase superfamily)
MIKLLVSDLDGTLLDHIKKVALRDREALTEAAGQGLAICLASGRMHSEITQVMNEIGIEAYSVSQNGAFIHLKDGRLLLSKSFAPELAVEIFEIAKPYDLVKFICNADGNHITHLSEASDRIQARMFEPIIVYPMAEEALTRDLPAAKFSFFGEMEVLQQVRKELNNHIGDQLTMYVSDHDCLDVMPLHVSKGDSLPLLLESIGLQADEIACIGDSFNDVSMFGITPHSFAMAGAHPDVKKAANYQVHSVAEALARIKAYNNGQSFEQQEIPS